MLTLLVAAAENGVIGFNGQLPWRLPADFQWFKRHTLGHSILMGRKTWDSLGRPLPGRANLVVSRQPDLLLPGAHVFMDVSEAIAYARQLDGGEEIFGIGGGELYRLLLPLADRVLLTRVHTSVVGDAFFPELIPAHWREASREEHPADEKHAYAFTFLDLRRVRQHA
ncbi:MAG: dihydrofolate reductase [Hymenobacteraceae bacterium]|nr:dihydrofolate reductase [Hymenobacteraceae bacterium]